jgi:chemotaxis protein CheD
MLIQPRDLVDSATARRSQREFGCAEVKVLPGECHATAQDVALVTLLGSCVAACLRDPVTGVGGMNHFMLPHDRSGGPVSRSARFGAFAMETLINRLLRLGARRDSLEAKVFGGGAVVPQLTSLNIGEANADFVLEFLKQEKITVSAHDLKGTEARKVHFFPRTGRVLVQTLKRAHRTRVVERDLAYSRRVDGLPSGGEVELFE